MSDFEQRAARAAFAFSLGVHALLFLLAVILVGMSAVQESSARAIQEEEFVLLSPEMLLIEEPDPQERKQFIDNSATEATEEAPDTQNISDRNSKAASDADPTPDATEKTISTEGDPENARDLRDQEFIDGPDAEDSAASAGGKPQPPAPEDPTMQPLDEQSPDPTEEKQPDLPQDETTGEEVLESIGDGDLLPLPPLRNELGGTEKPEKEKIEEKPPSAEEAAPPPVPPGQEADTAFVPQKRRQRINGTLSSRGDAAFDAKETPLGRYAALVKRRISKRWFAEVEAHRQFVTFATLRVSFSISKAGKVENLRIVRSQANAVIKDFTLSAILEADIPPIPKQLWEVLEDEQIDMNYDVVIY